MLNNLTIQNVLTGVPEKMLSISTLFYWVEVLLRNMSKSVWLKIARISIQGASLILLCNLLLRWHEQQHIPMSSLYESCLILAWLLTIIHVVFENLAGSPWTGVITAPLCWSVYAFATLSLPSHLQEMTPLVPALRSNWLLMHVTIMITSYAALLSGSLLAIAILVLGSKKGNSRTELITTLDSLSYRTLGIGFPLLTLGIISGSVWANESWGSYWSWDPKETWALITWFVFAIYLHIRLNRGWEGRKAAWVAAIGFIVVWLCYLGVNLLGTGLHSYGFVSDTPTL